MAKDYAEKLAKGGRSAVIIFIIGVILGYGLRIFISRRLSVEEFGLFYSILSIVGAFTIFKELGLLSSIAIKIPEFLHSGKSGKIKTIIKKSLLIQFTAALIIGAALIYLSNIILPSLQPSSITVLQIIALSFIASVFFEIFRAGLQGLGDINFYTAVEPLRLSIIFVASFILFSLGLGMIGLAIAYLAAAVILALVVPLYFWLKNKELLKTPSVKVSRDEFAKFTAIVWMGSLLSAILSYADTIMLAFLRAPKEAGFYQVALPTSQLLTFFLYPIMIVLVPFVAEMWTKKNKELITNVTSFAVKLLLIAIIPAAIVLEAVSGDIVRFVFGDNFVPAIPALQILLVGMFFYSFTLLFTTVILGISRPKDNVKVMAVMGVTNIVLDIVLIPLYGAIGAAIALSTAFFLGTIVSLYLLRRQIKFIIQYKNTAKAFIGGIITLAILLQFKSMLTFGTFEEVIVLVIAACIIYFVFIAITKTIDKRDFDLIERSNIMPKSLAKTIRKFIRE